MAFCPRCGASLEASAAFCPACGSAQPGAGPAAAPGAGGAPAVQQTQMAENVAGLLCYLVGWVTGLIFFLIDKRPYVQFHAKQSIVTFGGLNILLYVVGIVFGMGMMTGFGGFRSLSFGWTLYWLVDVACFVLWILLMIKAHQGERFRVPVAADLAEQIFGKS